MQSREEMCEGPFAKNEGEKVFHFSTIFQFPMKR